MEKFIYLLCLVAAFTSSILAIIKNLHIFQLNSYKEMIQLKWLILNVKKYWSVLAIAVLALIVLINKFLIFALLAIVFIVFVITNLPQKAKKPLVYTSRVKRMLFTISIILALYIWLTISIDAPYNYMAMCLFYFSTPFLVIIANVINVPVEEVIRRYYIRSAKKILRSCPNLIVIGITGSYGKTSVKFYLNTLLKSKYNVLMTPESFNTPMGIVKTIREQLSATHEIFICEMGAKYTNEIKEICDIVNPQHGIITSIGAQHLETFKTLDNIVKTKFELADSIPSDGMILLNGDNDVIRQNMPIKPHITYGTGSNNDFYAYDISVSQSGTSFSIKDSNGLEHRFQTQLIGEHNVTNLVGAIAFSNYLGISLNDLKLQVKKITAVPHRLQLIKTEAMTIIDDAYNSNPSGCRAALKTLALFNGCKVLVTPGMVELGVKQDEFNYEFGINAASVCDYIVLVGEKQTQPIYRGLLYAGYNKEQIYIASGIKEALNKVYALESEKRKIVLLENDLPDNY